MEVKLSPPLLEVVGNSVTMMEDRELELEVTVVVDVSFAMLELEVTEVVDVPVAVLGGRVAGGTIGNVVFWAGHPEESVSRRTGQ